MPSPGSAPSDLDRFHRCRCNRERAECPGAGFRLDTHVTRSRWLQGYSLPARPTLWLESLEFQRPAECGRIELTHDLARPDLCSLRENRQDRRRSRRLDGDLSLVRQCRTQRNVWCDDMIETTNHGPLGCFRGFRNSRLARGLVGHAGPRHEGAFVDSGRTWCGGDDQTFSSRVGLAPATRSRGGRASRSPPQPAAEAIPEAFVLGLLAGDECRSVRTAGDATGIPPGTTRPGIGPRRRLSPRPTRFRSRSGRYRRGRPRRSPGPAAYRTTTARSLTSCPRPSKAPQSTR